MHVARANLQHVHAGVERGAHLLDRLAGRALQLDFNGTTSFQLDRTAVFTLANSSSIQFDNAVTWSGNLVVPAGATASISTTSSFSVPVITEERASTVRRSCTRS